MNNPWLEAKIIVAEWHEKHQKKCQNTVKGANLCQYWIICKLWSTHKMKLNLMSSFNSARLIKPESEVLLGHKSDWEIDDRTLKGTF